MKRQTGRCPASSTSTNSRSKPCAISGIRCEGACTTPRQTIHLPCGILAQSSLRIHHMWWIRTFALRPDAQSLAGTCRGGSGTNRRKFRSKKTGGNKENEKLLHQTFKKLNILPIPTMERVVVHNMPPLSPLPAVGPVVAHLRNNLGPLPMTCVFIRPPLPVCGRESQSASRQRFVAEAEQTTYTPVLLLPPATIA